MDHTASIDPFRNLFSPSAHAWLRALSLRARARPLAEQGAAGAQALEQGRSCWLETPECAQVACESGTLWLTYDRQLRDIILEAGQSHRCQPDGRLCIHALDPSTFRVDSPAAAQRP